MLQDGFAQLSIVRVRYRTVAALDGASIAKYVVRQDLVRAVGVNTWWWGRGVNRRSLPVIVFNFRSATNTTRVDEGRPFILAATSGASLNCPDRANPD